MMSFFAFAWVDQIKCGNVKHIRDGETGRQGFISPVVDLSERDISAKMTMIIGWGTAEGGGGSHHCGECRHLMGAPPGSSELVFRFPERKFGGKRVGEAGGGKIALLQLPM